MRRAVDEHEAIALTLERLKDFVCDHQSDIAQYIFLASQRHKDVREALDTVCSGLELTGLSNMKIIRLLDNLDFGKLDSEKIFHLKKALDALDKYLLLAFYTAFQVACEHINSFFEDRAPHTPHVFLRVVNQENLFSLFSSPEIFVEEREELAKENIAFEAIAKGADYFCSNDIPTDVKAGRYFDNELIKDCVLAYEHSHFDENLAEFDQKWSNCWSKIKKLGSFAWVSRPPELCFKSTLTVPMSLTNSKLHHEFKSHFHIPEGPRRSILGLVSINHVNRNYFKPDIDRRLLYIVADLLSVYLVQQLFNTQYSSAYFCAKAVWKRFNQGERHLIKTTASV